MSTKKELIAQAEAQGIFFRSSWKKEEIEAAISSGVKFGDLVDQICPRSGLVFQVAIEDKREGLIHPRIVWYTQHPNYDVRYPAIRVIERGKAEGWNTFEKFKEEIKLLLDPPKPTSEFPSITLSKKDGRKKPYLAQIEGYDRRYTLKRKFISPVATKDNLLTFLLEEPGFYESKNGNGTIAYWSKEGDSYSEITKEKVLAEFVPYYGDPEIKQIEFYSQAAVGTEVIFEGRKWAIVADDSYDFFETQYHEDPWSTQSNYWNDGSHYSDDLVEVFRYFCRDLGEAPAVESVKIAESEKQNSEISSSEIPQFDFDSPEDF